MNITKLLSLISGTAGTQNRIDRPKSPMNQADFAGLVKRFQGPLFGFLGRMGFAQAQAEDLAQETFLRAWQNLEQYDAQRAGFSTWLFTIARNLAINERHRAASQHEVWEGLAPPDPPSEAPEPADLLERAQQGQRLRRALAQLPVADRCVLALAYISELDIASIARIEGCTAGAVKTRLHRARTRLSEILENPNA
ncbi:MAG: sigma-70 family RNA polymerase sigma factor [Polaromonas sp.]|nr:sigma-70 family RNA polymerase sigma factor [Polaromonas sp.]